MLRQEGHQPIAAYDQMQAMMFAVRDPMPDAIVLDLNMPGGPDGDTLRRLKASARTCNIPVIVLSGSPYPDTADKVREQGAEAFLSKPLNRAALVDELSKIAGLVAA
jgi:CheY-like chemotaxis protein